MATTVSLKHLKNPFCSRILPSIAAALVVMFGANPVFAESVEVRFVTFNVSFNSTDRQIEDDVLKVAPKADVIMFQEAKTVTIDNFLDNNWTVHQVVDQGDARRGSAIAIRNSIMTEKLGQGLILGVDRDTAAMLDRYIAWVDLELTNGRALRVMSLHMPPFRFEYLQPRMANNLVAFVEDTPYPAVVGGDWNFNVNNDKWDIKPRTGLASRGVGIDGFYYSAQVVEFLRMFELQGLNVNSDHDPVQMVTSVLAPESAVAGWMLY